MSKKTLAQLDAELGVSPAYDLIATTLGWVAVILAIVLLAGCQNG